MKTIRKAFEYIFMNNILQNKRINRQNSNNMTTYDEYDDLGHFINKQIESFKIKNMYYLINRKTRHTRHTRHNWHFEAKTARRGNCNDFTGCVYINNQQAIFDLARMI